MKKSILLFWCIMTSLVMSASKLSLEQARNSAEAFIQSKTFIAKSSESITIQQVKPYSKNSDDKAKVIAVNFANNNGFVLVGGNEHGNEIIGYCDHGAFDENSMPANMRAWLDCYIATASLAGDTKQARGLRATSHYPTKTPIAPLLKCKWNQDAPYNNDCPVVNDKRSPTGCTITAMAQIMYHHRWPTGATAAIPAYTPDNSGGTNYPTLPALEPTTFDWDKMYPTYTNNEDGSEVARLFKYLGFASQADYGSNETSAHGYTAMRAVVNYFNYSASAYAMWRRQLSYTQWIDKLYAELQANRPVLFSGSTPDVAHSFVVDGYDEEDYFHVNWGWGGMSDGYYRVLLMDPKEQGTGGSVDNDAYTYDQVAYFNVQPNTGQEAHVPRLTVLKNWLFTDPQGTGSYETRSSEFTSPFFEGNGYLVYPAINSHNFNADSAEFSLGCRLLKIDGSVTRDYEWSTAKIGTDKGLNDLSHIVYLNPETDAALTDGDYKLYFISKHKDAVAWQLDEGNDDHYIDIHIDNAKRQLTATSVSREPKLVVKEVKVNTATPMVGKPIDVTITIQNNGTAAYHGNLGITQNIGGNDNSWLAVSESDIEPGETINLALTFTRKKVGTISYNVDDVLGNHYYSGTIIVSESNTTSDIPLTITHRVTNANGTVIAAPRALIDLTITNNNDKIYQGDIFIYCFKWTGSDYKFVYSRYNETIPANQTVTLHRESPELTDAEYYTFNTMYMKDGQQVEQEASEVHYTTAPYYLTYDASGKATTHLVTEQVQPDATVCTVDLTKAPGITSVSTSANPNMIILTTENSTLAGDNIVKGGIAQNVKLTDAYPFYCPVAFTASHISYTRTPKLYYDINTNKGWSTMVLPFAATSCQTTIDGALTPLKWYTNSSNEGDILITNFTYENGSEMEFSLPESSLNSCHPYLLGIPAVMKDGKSIANIPITFSADNALINATKPIITGRGYKMVGTMTPIKDKENIYTLNADGSDFVLGTHSVDPFHAYFAPIALSSTASKLTINFNRDWLTSISTIHDNQPTGSQGPIYNLNGQRVTRAGKGIYIINGNKVIFK